MNKREKVGLFLLVMSVLALAIGSFAYLVFPNPETDAFYAIVSISLVYALVGGWFFLD